MKYSLRDSYIYSLLNIDSVVNKIGTQINTNLDNYKISDDQLNIIISDIKGKSANVGKDKLIKHLQLKEIILVNAPGITIPAWCIPSQNGGIIAVCNIFGKVRINSNNLLTYQVKELFGLIMVANVLRNFFLNENKFLYNSQLIANVGVVYTRLFMRTLDTMFSINAMGNERESQFIEYMISKFYLKRVMEKNFATEQMEVSNIANILRKTKKSSVMVYSIEGHAKNAADYPEEIFASIDTFCKALAENIPTLNRLETNIFIRKLILLLGEKSALMIESPQYLIAYLTSSAFNTNLIKDFQVAGIAGNDLLSKIALDVSSIDE